MDKVAQCVRSNALFSCDERWHRDRTNAGLTINNILRPDNLSALMIENESNWEKYKGGNFSPEKKFFRLNDMKRTVYFCWIE